MQQLIVIEGPTASGKTALGVALAKKLNTVVISADSRQFYKEVSIGTAKPSIEEMDGVPHYFVDSHSLTDPVSAGRFEREALELITNELAHLSNIILVGGSGMFIDALCIGLDPIPADQQLNESIRFEYSESGIESLLNELEEKDPIYFNEVDKSNVNRIIRAIEVIRLTNKTYSELRENKPSPRPFTTKRFVIEHQRNLLYERINQRVDNMLKDGLLAEVESVSDLKQLSSLQTVGYKEVFQYLNGEYTLSECIDKIKQHTRNYAKRQLTWFKRHEYAVWIPYTSTEFMCKTILQHLDIQDH